MSKTKKGLDLNRVVLLGRTFEEYLRFFALVPEELRGKTILDVASGVSSFTAEANAHGLKVTAFDRIYSLSDGEIRTRCEQDLSEVTRSVGDREVYRWDFYKSPEGMREFRGRAYKAFLADYISNRDRYVAGDLPRTPFQDTQFDVTLVSYLLFVYEEQLAYEFHKESIRELMRVTCEEIRIYPIVTFEAEASQHLARLVTEAEFATWRFEEIRTDFEFLRNSNSYLKISPR